MRQKALLVTEMVSPCSLAWGVGMESGKPDSPWMNTQVGSSGVVATCQDWSAVFGSCFDWFPGRRFHFVPSRLQNQHRDRLFEISRFPHPVSSNTIGGETDCLGGGGGEVGGLISRGTSGGGIGFLAPTNTLFLANT